MSRAKPIEDKTPPEVIQTLRRRLERWELAHLRVLAKQLAEQLDEERAEHERTRDRHERAEEYAEYWRENAMQLTEELFEAGETVGLTKDGALVVISQPVQG